MLSLFMNGDVALGICIFFVSALAFILFGAPFLPFLRHWAIGSIFVLAILGNIFVLVVIIVTLCIRFFGTQASKCVEESKQRKGKPMPEADKFSKLDGKANQVYRVNNVNSERNKDVVKRRSRRSTVN